VESLCSAGEKPHATLGTAVKLQDYAQPREIVNSTPRCADHGSNSVTGVFRNLHTSGDDGGLSFTELEEKK
jgi:hypothetical protein